MESGSLEFVQRRHTQNIFGIVLVYAGCTAVQLFPAFLFSLMSGNSKLVFPSGREAWNIVLDGTLAGNLAKGRGGWCSRERIKENGLTVL